MIWWPWVNCALQHHPVHVPQPLFCQAMPMSNLCHPTCASSAPKQHDSWDLEIVKMPQLSNLSLSIAIPCFDLMHGHSHLKVIVILPWWLLWSMIHNASKWFLAIPINARVNNCKPPLPLMPNRPLTEVFNAIGLKMSMCVILQNDTLSALNKFVVVSQMHPMPHRWSRSNQSCASFDLCVTQASQIHGMTDTGGTPLHSMLEMSLCQRPWHATFVVWGLPRGALWCHQCQSHGWNHAQKFHAPRHPIDTVHTPWMAFVHMQHPQWWAHQLCAS